MVRDDLRGPTRAPQPVHDYLVRLGGTNPYGEPIYRLILASSHYMKVAGEFCIWDENIPVQERTGFKRASIELEVPEPIFTTLPTGERKFVGYQSHKEALIPTGHQPMRVEIGLREVQRYPDVEGWILQRWYPAHMWGSPEEWNRVTLLDGTSLLGPYPEQGDYDCVVGPWPKVPGLSRLAAGVSFLESQIENNKDNFDTRRRKRLYAAEEQERKRAEAFQEKIVNLIKERTSMLNTVSLAAGRHRQQLAERAGLKGHFGN